MRSIAVYSRDGCHLCDALIEELQPLVEGQLAVEIRDIDSRREWHEKHWSDIPVVEYEGIVVCKHFLDRDAIKGILRG